MSDFQHPLVGREILYTARHPGAEPKRGVVTSVDQLAGVVFVNYGPDSPAEATFISDCAAPDGRSLGSIIDRGTGRTTRQIVEAPDAFVIVVHNLGMQNMVRTLQRKHAPDKTMDVVMCTDAYYRLRGTDLPIVVDHASWPSVDDRTACFIRMHNERHGFAVD